MSLEETSFFQSCFWNSPNLCSFLFLQTFSRKVRESRRILGFTPERIRAHAATVAGGASVGRGEGRAKEPSRRRFCADKSLWDKRSGGLPHADEALVRHWEGRVNVACTDFAPVWPQSRNRDRERRGKWLAASP